VGWIRINVQNIVTNVIVSKRNDINVMIIKKVSAKKKAERIEMDIDIGDDSWKITIVWRMPSKCDSIGVVTNTHEGFAITV